MKAVPKFTNYYCWHMVTLTLLAMSIAFLLAAVRPESFELGFLMSLLSFAFAAWNISLWIWARQRPLQMPQWILFIAMALLGMIGIVSAPGNFIH